jgi:hypothetical protein
MTIPRSEGTGKFCTHRLGLGGNLDVTVRASLQLSIEELSICDVVGRIQDSKSVILVSLRNCLLYLRSFSDWNLIAMIG